MAPILLRLDGGGDGDGGVVEDEEGAALEEDADVVEETNSVDTTCESALL
jgi:hypothetical protein